MRAFDDPLATRQGALHPAGRLLDDFLLVVDLQTHRSLLTHHGSDLLERLLVLEFQLSLRDVQAALHVGRFNSAFQTVDGDLGHIGTDSEYRVGNRTKTSLDRTTGRSGDVTSDHHTATASQTADDETAGDEVLGDCLGNRIGQVVREVRAAIQGHLNPLRVRAAIIKSVLFLLAP